MGSATIKGVLDLLRGEKVKDRQEGFVALQTFFADDSAVDNVDTSGRGDAWLVIFSAVFSAVEKEKQAYAKKGDASSATVKRRLADAASAVRSLVERSVLRMNGKVVKAVLSQLSKHVIDGNELLAPVALQYAKAIRSVLSYTPHLERLGEKMWTSLLQLSLNVVLGDRVKRSLEETDIFIQENEDAQAGSSGEDAGDDDMSTPGPSSSRKRKVSAIQQHARRTPFSASPVPSTHPVTQEQVEFMSLVVLLLRSPSAPLLSPPLEYSHVPTALFNRLVRILQTYPGDSSIHHDYLLALSAALSHVALNDCVIVTMYAREAWDGLLNMWGTKNQRMKQDLVIVLQTLFPYYTAEPLDPTAVPEMDCAKGVSRLWHLLSREADSRWGVDGLNLDRLRLEVREIRADATPPQPFVGSTYRFGWQFDSGHALAWMILELQSSCTAKLHFLADSVHSMESTHRVAGKRVKLESPIKTLLDCISHTSASATRSYHLQSLLFFIDKHWSILHEELQQQVISLLLQFVSFEDASIQSWTFLCLAAIAHEVGSSLREQTAANTGQEGPQSLTWDAIYAHAMRRTTMASVSRAACHAASVFMLHADELLTSQRLVAEIETLAKDLEVQGPVFPHDSVCTFLDRALRIASQDARLYRMQMEERVLTWFLDTWRVETTSKTKLLPYTVVDLLTLLESISTFSIKSNLVGEMLLPDNAIVRAAEDHCYSAVIRDFTLHARLPSAPEPSSTTDPRSSTELDPDNHDVVLDDLTQPRGRERRVSTFLMKVAEDLFTAWEASKEMPAFVNAERVRSSLDVAFLCLSYEAVLVINGIRSTRRVIQAACRLIQSVFPLVSEKRWTSDERSLMLHSLQPVILARTNSTHVPLEMLASAGPYTGVRREVLRTLHASAGRAETDQRVRRHIQRIIFRSIDVQETFNGLLGALKTTLRVASGAPTNIDSDSQAMEIDAEDDFGQPRAAQTAVVASESSGAGAGYMDRSSIEICMATLAIVPSLQSISGQSTRDKDLAEIVLESADSRLLGMASAYFTIVKAGTLSVSNPNLATFLNLLLELWEQYAYARDEEFHRLTLLFLHSTMNQWMDPATPDDICTSVRDLWKLVVEKSLLPKRRMTSWRGRDDVVCFLDASLTLDPEEGFWAPIAHDVVIQGPGSATPQDDAEPTIITLLPASVLPTLGSDVDIRVRFRASAAAARMFARASKLGQNPGTLYTDVLSYLTSNEHAFERMITRIVCLANIMIVSSAVRRGAYWNLLEGCLFVPEYANHTEAALAGVSRSLGLSSLAELFEHYASQIASAICSLKKDFLSLPPHLLGFKERRQCAEAVFRAFAPANLLHDDRKHGLKLFHSHCAAIHKLPADGLQACFPEIVGYEIVILVGQSLTNNTPIPEDLAMRLRHTMRELDAQTFDSNLRRTTDVIVATIVRTLGDQNISRSGPIYVGTKLSGFGEETMDVLDQLFTFRRVEEFQFHEPNVPLYSTEAVLKALQWFAAWIPEANEPSVTYHVIHQLFADVERCSFINEQMRLLNSICAWISTRRSHFENPTLLRTLMNLSSTIIPQIDTARAAQSILQWGFQSYVKAGENARFVDILVQLGSIAQDYKQCSLDRPAVTLGEDLTHWVESTMQSLVERNTSQPLLTRALASWPFNTSSPLLLRFQDGLTSSQISQLLSEAPPSSNKFRLARRIYNLASDHEDSDAKFTNLDFWRLKQCIPPSDKLHDEDMDAFILLLMHRGGIIRSPDCASNASTQTVREKHREFVSSPEQISTRDAAQRAIVISLLEGLDAASTSQINLAYRTLRFVMSVYALDKAASESWCRDYAGDLQCLQAYPVSLPVAPCHDLLQTLASSHFVQTSQHQSTWITSLTLSICGALAARERFYGVLALILQASAAVAETIMPVLVHVLLDGERADRSADSDALRTALSNHFDEVLSSGDADVGTLRAIIDTVLYLRHFQPPSVRDARAYETWLRVNYRLLAKNSVRCGAYTTALLFLELGAEGEAENHSGDNTTQDILFDIYSRIDEPDGFYGIKSGNLNDFLIKRLHHEKQWDTAFRYHGAALAARPVDAMHSHGIVQSLHAFGFDRLAMTALGSTSSQTNDTKESDMSYELGWRTGAWDLPDCRAGQYPGASLYLSLRAIHCERDSSRVDTIIRKALLQEFTQLQSQGDEDLSGVRQTAQTLMCLRQIRWWKGTLLPTLTHSSDGQLNRKVWGSFNRIDGLESFDDAESVMAARISLIRARRQKEEREQIGELLSPVGRRLVELERSCLLHLSRAARDAHRTQAALNAVTQAQVLGKHSVPEVEQEFANVLWIMKEPRLATSSLQDTLSGMEQLRAESTGEERATRASLLARLGTWCAQASLEKPDTIVERYFNPATQMILDKEDTSDPAQCATVFHHFAIFADHQYHAIANSPDVLRWRVYVDRKTEEVKAREEEVQRAPASSIQRKGLEHNLSKARHELRLDQVRIKDSTDARDKFLLLAANNYSECLAHSDIFDSESIIRLCSLWLANFERPDVCSDFQAVLQRVASHKFIFLAHQLAARLSPPTSSRKPSSQSLLHDLLGRMCREHPFHSLYQVLCLMFEKGPLDVAPGRRQSGRTEQLSSPSDRAAAARTLYDRLRADAQVQGRIQDVELLWRASFQWAMYPKTKVPESGSHRIPEEMAIKKIGRLRVPVMTANTPVDPSGRYEDCVWINHFDPMYSVAGGLNQPKITVCVGDDGQRYKQLYKGGDDLRQDAVMEQVFDLVNILLSRDRETRRRDLSVRGYQVIPLASQAGILEFVKDTTPLASWLSGAHLRYRPGDMRPNEVLKRVKTKQSECNNDRTEMTKCFTSLRQRFRPIMRHYFTERHKEPLAWFTMRLKYSRSVATTSIVGHILGLGDRHMSNILMDNNTGEMVHIDLGIAFDQGKMLPIPERVPFRLTADVVDGLGTSGTQGVFQRCAEETLRVLREESEVLFTVLEVFKHDPLHSWVASEVKMKRVQGSGHDATLTGEAVRMMIGIDIASGTAGVAADRALSAVRRRLDKTLSVEYTVNELVAEATDLENLAQMYYGWSAWY